MSSENKQEGIHPSKIHKNGSFTSSFGFVLACVGSAVGLGNIWMFPYRLGQYGGAAFLIPYLLFILLFGFCGLAAEFAAGRLSQTGTLGTYRYCWASRGLSRLGGILGWIPLLGSLGIAIGYAVIIGWVLRSLVGSVTGRMLSMDAAQFYGEAAADFGSIPWNSAVIFITVLILFAGAVTMIERANKIMMPIFFFLFAIVAVRVFFLPGAEAGYRFLFVPDWAALLKVDTWVMAMGQAFFSLSITGSGMIVYGSYLGKDSDIPKASLQTAGYDTIAAMLSALAVMPAVFAFGIEPGSGPSLLFITIPRIFSQMPFGRFFSAIFFLSVAFAGITSLINMFEAVIESWQHRFHLPRRTAVLLCGGIALLVGIFIESEARVGAWMDFITIYVVPFGAMLGAVSIYYILGYDKIASELMTGRDKPLPRIYRFVAKYIYVFLTIAVFLLGIAYHGIG